MDILFNLRTLSDKLFRVVQFAQSIRVMKYDHSLSYTQNTSIPVLRHFPIIRFLLSPRYAKW